MPPVKPAKDIGALEEQASAWQAVTELLGELDPKWHKRRNTGVASALLSIRGLADTAVDAERYRWLRLHTHQTIKLTGVALFQLPTIPVRHHESVGEAIDRLRGGDE